MVSLRIRLNRGACACQRRKWRDACTHHEEHANFSFTVHTVGRTYDAVIHMTRPFILRLLLSLQYGTEALLSYQPELQEALATARAARMDFERNRTLSAKLGRCLGVKR
eukprot:6176548-Pleurochrysis_carterae.AAC.2